MTSKTPKTPKTLETLETLDSSIFSMSDDELCKEVWRRIVKEYLEDGKHPTMVLKASELLAKTAGCLYGGSTTAGNSDDTGLVFVNDTFQNFDEIEE
jgi:hypothetical protein